MDEKLFHEKLFPFVNGGYSQFELGWKYGGLDIWPIIKAQILTRASNIYNAGRTMALSASTQVAQEPFLRRVASHFRKPSFEPVKAENIPNLDWPALPRHALAADVLCLGYSTNHKQFNESYFQLCMDPLRVALEKVGVSSACLITGMKESDEAIQKAALKETYGIEVQFKVVRSMAKLLPPINLLEYPGFPRFWRELERLLGGMFMPIEHLEKIIRETAVVGHWLHHCLKASDVKGVIVSAYYGLMGHGGAWACRRLGLPIFDVQHGIAGKAHHAYSWPNAPVIGFNTVPSGFLTWSQGEANEMRSVAGASSPTLIPVGNVWRLLEDMLDNTGDSRLLEKSVAHRVNAYLRQETQTILSAKERTVGTTDILLALHPDEKVPWLNDLVAQTDGRWRFWIRAHPGELRNVQALEKRKSEIGDNVFIIESSQAPLNVILRNVDVILTKYSSVAFDAAAFGVPTVAYSEAARFFFGSSLAGKVGFALPAEESIAAAINTRTSSSYIKPPSGTIDLSALGRKLKTALAVDNLQ